MPVLQHPQDGDQRDRHGGDDRVLAAEVGLGPLLHGARDLAHAVVARGLCQQALGNDESVENGGGGADERYDHSVIGQKVGQVPIPPVV
jgi:hypothetical protein